MRWVWIDRFERFESKRRAVAVKNWSLAEEPFGEHFPGWPLVPASLLIEGLAQTGGILVGEANDFREKVVLAKIPFARVTRDAFAGETLTYTATVTTLREEGASIHGTIDSAGDRVMEAEIFFAHLDQARSGQLFGDRNFVFSGELKNLLGLAKLAETKAASDS